MGGASVGGAGGTAASRFATSSRVAAGPSFATSSRFVTAASRFATSSLVPRVDARARCAAASPLARRSQELSGGGCSPVEEPTPLSPRLIAGLSSSAKAGPIGCTSGRCAFDFGVLPGFFGWSGFFAMTRIWDERGRHKRAKSKGNIPCRKHRCTMFQDVDDIGRLRRRRAVLSAAVSTIRRDE